MPPPGESLPRPCIAPGCTYGHNPSLVAAAMAEMLQTNEPAQGGLVQGWQVEILKVEDGARGDPYERLARQIRPANAQQQLGSAHPRFPPPGRNGNLVCLLEAWPRSVACQRRNGNLSS
eukprot:4276276-Pleurochrysis_carterae.AAC.1